MEKEDCQVAWGREGPVIEGVSSAAFPFGVCGLSAQISDITEFCPQAGMRRHPAARGRELGRGG